MITEPGVFNDGSSGETQVIGLSPGAQTSVRAGWGDAGLGTKLPYVSTTIFFSKISLAIANMSVTKDTYRRKLLQNFELSRV